MCGTEYKVQKGNFMSGGKSVLWKGNGGYLPFCKTCCESMMEDLTSFFGGNEEHALRRICQIFDWYYSPDASTMTRNQVRDGKSRLLIYPSKMCARQISLRGSTYLDTLRDMYEESLAAVPVEVEETPEEEDDGFVVTKDMVRTWGSGYTKDQYQYLEEEYRDWITKNVCNTKSQEEIYRNIALAQLDIRIARQKGGKVSDAQKALQELMNSANILPKQTAVNAIADTQTFSTLLKKYEETDPTPEPDERWKDVDNIRRYTNTWYRGGLAKALKVNGYENVALYDEAMAELNKYTVVPDKSKNDVDPGEILRPPKEAEDE